MLATGWTGAGVFLAQQVYAHNHFLVYLAAFLLICFVLSLFIPRTNKIRFLKEKTQARMFRINLLGLFLVVFGSLSYWGIDTYVTRLPHPVVPFIFFVLIYAIIFGFGNSFIVFIFSTWFVLEYLYRANLLSVEHSLSVILTILALLLGLVIGLIIHIYQRRLRWRIEELRALVKLRDQLTSETAHELKTPLTTIKLYAQMIEKSAGKKMTRSDLLEKIGMIELEADKLTVLIDSLLEFSRLQSGKLKLNTDLFNLSDMTAERVKAMREIWPDHTFVLGHMPKNAIILGDKLRLDQVLSNLLTNAAKYSPQNTPITVRLSQTAGEYILTVTDKGYGIPPAVQKRIFEPFYQLEGADNLGFNGLGLGLYICQQILSRHNGSISVSSQPGRGSTFFVSLPRSQKRPGHARFAPVIS